MRLFLLLQRGLTTLEHGKHSEDLLTSYFLKLADVIGLAPSLDVCASCGGTTALDRFSFSGGGVVCASCRPEGSVRLRSGVTEYLNALAVADLRALPKSVPAMAAEALGVTRRFVEYHLDRRLTGPGLRRG